MTITSCYDLIIDTGAMSRLACSQWGTYQWFNVSWQLCKTSMQMTSILSCLRLLTVTTLFCWWRFYITVCRWYCLSSRLKALRDHSVLVAILLWSFSIQSKPSPKLVLSFDNDGYVFQDKVVSPIYWCGRTDLLCVTGRISMTISRKLSGDAQRRESINNELGAVLIQREKIESMKKAIEIKQGAKVSLLQKKQFALVTAPHPPASSSARAQRPCAAHRLLPSAALRPSSLLRRLSTTWCIMLYSVK